MTTGSPGAALGTGGGKNELAVGHTDYMCDFRSSKQLGIRSEAQEEIPNVISGHYAKELKDAPQGEAKD